MLLLSDNDDARQWLIGNGGVGVILTLVCVLFFQTGLGVELLAYSLANNPAVGA